MKKKKKKHVENTDISITYFVKPPKAVGGIGHRKEVQILEQWAKRSNTDAQTEC